jgi:pyruvate ferredoxin oxidoreductase alpha subunit
MVGPEAFSEVKYIMHAKQMLALDAIPAIAGEFAESFGRESGGLVRGYRADDAETVVVALGSVLGTIEDVVDELREQGRRDREPWAVKCFRPYPLERGPRGPRAREADRRPGEGVRGRRRRHRGPERAPGALGPRRRRPRRGRRPRRAPDHQSVAAPPARRRLDGRLSGFTFLDMNWELVERELERLRARGRSGPHAENILRDVGIVAARPM